MDPPTMSDGECIQWLEAKNEQMKHELFTAEAIMRNAADFLSSVPRIPNYEGAGCSMVLKLNAAANHAMLARR